MMKLRSRMVLKQSMIVEWEIATRDFVPTETESGAGSVEAPVGMTWLLVKRSRDELMRSGY